MVPGQGDRRYALALLGGGQRPGLSSFCRHPELQSEEPFVVRLLFEPSGRPDSQQDYYLTAKENLCVVCGKADSYIR